MRAYDHSEKKDDEHAVYDIDRSRLSVQVTRWNGMIRRNLVEVVCFLLICIGAYNWRDFNLFEQAAEPLRQILGYPPPALYVSIALMVYVAAVVTLRLTAMARDEPPELKWQNLGYRTAFFMFYSFSGAVAEHFVPVFVSGLLLYAMEQCHIKLYSVRMITEERELPERF
ncbi:MAG: hypothetical protein C0622_02540 [Desulfuromonas sp.]|nr:MAG: hypothetical protein C0622_02540 [Desulfuromonas sp.]